uniref:LIM zinc-binding domain-containing protein n=1 Tax=Macrostomum lignano TaxID=282301 RepID=A0A1I8F2P6_9PLAT
MNFLIRSPGISAGNVNRKPAAAAAPPIALACSQCSCALAGCRYVLLDDKEPACLSCFDSRLATPAPPAERRSGCDSKDVSYGQRHWHEACFRCAGCSAQLAGSSFSVKSDAIYCLMCYETRFAERCSRCREAFKAGQRKFEFRSRHYKGRPYHSDCLRGGHCAKPPLRLKFTSHEDRPFCGDCYGELFARRCSACLKPITGFTGSKFISFEQRDWHSQCFNCARCAPAWLAKASWPMGRRSCAHRVRRRRGQRGRVRRRRPDAAKSASTSVKILSRVSHSWLALARLKHIGGLNFRMFSCGPSRLMMMCSLRSLRTGAGMGLAHSLGGLPSGLSGSPAQHHVDAQEHAGPAHVAHHGHGQRDGAGHGVAAVGVEVVRGRAGRPQRWLGVVITAEMGWPLPMGLP